MKRAWLHEGTAPCFASDHEDPGHERRLCTPSYYSYLQVITRSEASVIRGAGRVVASLEAMVAMTIKLLQS